MRVHRMEAEMATNLQRKSIRLKGYDYSQRGAYFITICTKAKRCLFWKNGVGARIARPHFELSDIGNVVDIAINNIHEKYPAILVDKYVIMPNHIHIILMTQNEAGKVTNSKMLTASPAISIVINQMKGFVTKKIGESIWQKLFYDHIIRIEAEYREIWEYVDTNPAKWQDDCYYAKGTG